MFAKFPSKSGRAICFLNQNFTFTEKNNKIIHPSPVRVCGRHAREVALVEDELLPAGHREVVDVEDVALRLVRLDRVLGVDLAREGEVCTREKEKGFSPRLT